MGRLTLTLGPPNLIGDTAWHQRVSDGGHSVPALYSGVQTWAGGGQRQEDEDTLHRAAMC